MNTSTLRRLLPVAILLAGLAIFLLLGLVAHLALRRWHETAGAGEDA